jgi:hypothetical protein
MNVTDPAMNASKLDVGDGHAQSWIGPAQDLSAAEIVVVMCDENVDTVKLFTEGARTGTPKDLAAWLEGNAGVAP